jgi:LIVCS family branched-chain amino acid:cation transporter
MSSLRSHTFKTGLALFSMFFGAGNVVYPLVIGQYAQDSNMWGLLGLLITDIGVTFLGLISVTLFQGDYDSFFGRLGKWAGFVIAVLILGLIGPFGALPRSITLSYSTTKMFWPAISLPIFSLVSCLIIFLLTIRKNKIVDVIGKVLTPLLLGSLALIILKGILTGPKTIPSFVPPIDAFFHGMEQGLQTMDLLGAFFFSSVMVVAISEATARAGDFSPRAIIKQSLKACVIGATLLGLTYLGFGMLASSWRDLLSTQSPADYIAALSIEILGPYAGFVACVAVALACLTTAMALAVVSADFMEKDIFKEKAGFGTCLLITLVISYFISIMEFTGIMAFLAPILILSYPALITLSIFNLLHKLTGLRWVITPTVTVFVLTLILRFL